MSGSIPRQDVHGLARHDGVAHLQPRRLEDVALLAVRICQERDPRRAVRVMLDRRHRRRDVALVALEIDDAVVPLVTPPRHQDVSSP